MAAKLSRSSTDGGSIQSVDRALTLLDLLRAGGPTALKVLAARSGLKVSTCHHLLSTLVKWGYVSRSLEGRDYVLGARVLELAQGFMGQVELPRRAQIVLDKISQVTGETVHLAALQMDFLVTLAKRESRHALRVETGSPGKSDALHATATGKALLAWLPEDEIRRLLSIHSMPQFTERTITDPNALIEHLRLVRRTGFAMDDEEFQPGIVCLGASIRNHLGSVVGAISVSAPAVRATEIHLERIRESVLAGVRELSHELGNPGANLVHAHFSGPVN